MQTAKGFPEVDEVDEQRGVSLDALLNDVSYSKDLVNASPSSSEAYPFLSQLLVNSSINSAKEDRTENFRWNGEQCDTSPVITVLKISLSWRALQLNPRSSAASRYRVLFPDLSERSVRTLVEVLRWDFSISAWMPSMPAAFPHCMAVIESLTSTSVKDWCPGRYLLVEGRQGHLVVHG